MRNTQKICAYFFQIVLLFHTTVWSPWGRLLFLAQVQSTLYICISSSASSFPCILNSRAEAGLMSSSIPGALLMFTSLRRGPRSAISVLCTWAWPIRCSHILFLLITAEKYSHSLCFPCSASVQKLYLTRACFTLIFFLSNKICFCVFL